MFHEDQLFNFTFYDAGKEVRYVHRFLTDHTKNSSHKQIFAYCAFQCIQINFYNLNNIIKDAITVIVPCRISRYVTHRVSYY